MVPFCLPRLATDTFSLVVTKGNLVLRHKICHGMLAVEIEDLFKLDDDGRPGYVVFNNQRVFQFKIQAHFPYPFFAGYLFLFSYHFQNHREMQLRSSPILRPRAVTEDEASLLAR